MNCSGNGEMCGENGLLRARPCGGLESTRPLYRRFMRVLTTLVAAMMVAGAGWAAGQTLPASTQRRRPPRAMPLPPEVRAAQKFSVILGCPTDRSVVVSVLSSDARQ